MFNGRMKSALVPGEYFSIDETLYAMHHQIAFRQYNPNESAKNRLLYKSVNDALSTLTYQVIPYYEKPVDVNGSYLLGGTENYVKHLVE